MPLDPLCLYISLHLSILYILSYPFPMQLKLFNTLTRQKEDFVPLMEDPNYTWPKKDFVWLYSCGPTVYYTPHIGNLRATFTADLIRNTLKLFGYNVVSVMNITDVGHLVSDADDGEDKLEKWAKRDGISARKVAEKYEGIFMKSMQELNIEPFDFMPKATKHIQKQIDLIKTLESKGYTYTVDGDGIYMDTSKVEDYGKLMGPNYKKRLADLQAGERVEMGGKKHPTDFALRKFSPNNEKRQMERDSPRWVGFPGRHIECSAMATQYLWEQFDIHHGGADHITIHHPNEIAQSECAFDVHPWVKYRAHNEFLQVDGGKMSKSLWNVYNLEDIKAKWFFSLDLRYFYFMAQYGNFQNFTRELLESAHNRKNAMLNKLISIFLERKYLFQKNTTVNYLFFKKQSELRDNSIKVFDSIIENTLWDNFNAQRLLTEIDKLISHYVLDVENESIDEVYIDDTIKFLLFIDDSILKINILDELNEIEKHYISIKNTSIPSDITSLADQRLQAKQEKNYALADELRNKITAAGREVKDTKDGYELKRM